ncbi:MAG: iron ABC transporter permease, partial [Minwuiales bacterium]|nr:iron ABC transporter permease [Minwuiales bacterium]
MTASRWLIAGLSGLVGLLFAGSLAVGPEMFPLPVALRDIAAGNDSIVAIVLVEIRLPRAVLGVLVGATLGLTGAILQGLLRNPLAEPGLIGISNAAGLGAVTVFYLGFGSAFALAVPVGGIAGAIVAVGVVFLLAGRDASVLTLVLAGVAIGSFCSALTALILNFSPNPFAALEIVFWLLGSLSDRSLDHVYLAAPLILVGWLLMAGVGRPLDALTLGEDTAQSLGIDLRRLRGRIIVGTALAVGPAVAVTGGIAFVGLVVPHLLRPLVGYQPSRLLPVSALGGAA